MEKYTFTVRVTDEEFNALAEKAKADGLGAESMEFGVLMERGGLIFSYVVRFPDVVFTVERNRLAVSSGAIDWYVRNAVLVSRD